MLRHHYTYIQRLHIISLSRIFKIPKASVHLITLLCSNRLMYEWFWQSIYGLPVEFTNSQSPQHFGTRSWFELTINDLHYLVAWHFLVRNAYISSTRETIFWMLKFVSIHFEDQNGTDTLTSYCFRVRSKLYLKAHQNTMKEQSDDIT